MIHLKREGVIHCDIKPENILIKNPDNFNCEEIILADFGSSTLSWSKKHTYIQSRYYRSPEVILEIEYSHEIDLWGTACVLAELELGTPLFPGENELDQLNRIAGIIGDIPIEMVKQTGPYKKEFFTIDNELIPCEGFDRLIREGVTLNMIEADDFVSFLSGCLQWSPNDRLTLNECKTHPFLHSKVQM